MANRQVFILFINVSLNPKAGDFHFKFTPKADEVVFGVFFKTIARPLHWISNGAPPPTEKALGSHRGVNFKRVNRLVLLRNKSLCAGVEC